MRKLAGNRPLKLHGEVPHLDEAFVSGGGASLKPMPAAKVGDHE
jgi:multidrug efflux pump